MPQEKRCWEHLTWEVKSFEWLDSKLIGSVNFQGDHFAFTANGQPCKLSIPAHNILRLEVATPSRTCTHE